MTAELLAVVLGPPAVYGVASAVEDLRNGWRARRARLLAREQGELLELSRSRHPGGRDR